MYGKLTKEQRLFAKMNAILEEKGFRIVDEEKHAEELKNRGIKFPEVSRAYYAKNQVIFERTYKIAGHEYDAYVYTSFDNQSQTFAPKNMCGVWVIFIKPTGKKRRVRQLWRTGVSFIENFEVEIELSDHLVNNPPKAKNGEYLELHRDKKRVCSWVRYGVSGILEKRDLRENLPEEDYWWVKPAKKQISSKKSYELTRPRHGHKMQKRKQYVKKKPALTAKPKKAAKNAQPKKRNKK